MKRRDWLKSAILTGTAGVAYGCGVRRDPPMARPTGNGGRPPGGPFRNVIFLAYDGTGYEDAAAAGHFSRRLLDRPLVFDRLMGAGAAGTVRTHSLTSVVTDSAAATSAWATGRKIVNGALSQYPDGTRLATILELARDRGLATGLVTSTRMTHATPAGWAAHVGFRNEEADIADQYLDARPDVLLGGGQGPFTAGEREDGRDLFAEFRALGYDVLHTAEDLERSNGSRLLGTFTPGMEHLPYEVDRRFQSHPAPSLATLTRKALDVLAGSERGFVLQVEAGRIDHANHSNDPGAMIWDWMASEDALAVMVDFVDRRDDTILIAVPDHDTGGGVVYGFGPWYRRSTQAFETLDRRRASHEWLVRHRLGDDPSAEDVREAVERYLGIPVSPARAAAIRDVLTADEITPEFREGHWNAHATQPDNTLAHLLSISRDWEPDRPNIAFATGQHTAGLVPALLYGRMVPNGNLGVIDNTDFFRIMTAGLGIDYENPELTEEEALEIGAAPPADAVMVHA